MPVWQGNEGKMPVGDAVFLMDRIDGHRDTRVGIMTKTGLAMQTDMFGMVFTDVVYTPRPLRRAAVSQRLLSDMGRSIRSLLMLHLLEHGLRTFTEPFPTLHMS